MFLNELPIVMIRCLLLTIFIETFFAFIFGIRDKSDIFIVILCNVITNPLVVVLPVWFYIRFNSNAQKISLIFLEISAFLAEGFIYKKSIKYKKINPFLFSLILNIISFTFGEIINKLI